MILIANSEGAPGIAKTVDLLKDGVAAIDASVEGICLVEADPTVRSVGYGGWPNLIGEMEFDAAVMDGRTREIGAVAALKGFVPAAKVAREVLRRLPHALLAGDGAARFAAETGFSSTDTLLDDSRRVWRNVVAQRLTEDDVDRFPDIPLIPLAGLIKDPERVRDTTVYLARDTSNNVAAATSTSGWAWSYPGRVGDSPIPGAGFYADSRFGAAACTHTGEMTMRTGTARSIVLAMQLGQSLDQAVELAVNDLADLKDGFLGGVVIHAIDADDNHRVVNFRCQDPVRYWHWNASMSEPEQRLADRA